MDLTHKILIYISLIKHISQKNKNIFILQNETKQTKKIKIW